jgi:hypothetical protein
MSGGPIIRKSHARDPVACGIAAKDDSDPKHMERGSGKAALCWQLFQALGINVDFQFPGTNPESAPLLRLVSLGLLDERGGAVANIRISPRPDNEEGVIVAWMGPQ